MKKLSKKKIREEVWNMMYALALKDSLFLKGMIIVSTDSWDDEQFKSTYKHLKNGGKYEPSR